MERWREREGVEREGVVERERMCRERENVEILYLISPSDPCPTKL